MQKKKYYYKKVKCEELLINEDGVCLEIKDFFCLDLLQLDYSYGVSDLEEVSVVNFIYFDYSYECLGLEEFCRIIILYYDISNGC